MHHGQSRGKRKTQKSMLKHVNFTKSGEHFTKSEGKFAKVGENNIFSEIGGKCTETAKIGGNKKFVVGD